MIEAREPSVHSAPRQRWSLTKEAFDRLLAWLDPDVEAAGEKYLLVRRNLVRFFEGRGCPQAEDHADEVINRLARKLSEGEVVRDINAYSYGMARLLLLEILKEREREEKALRELPPLQLVEPSSTDVDEGGRRLECLTSCLDRLPADARQLIVEYYQGDKRSKIDNRKRMAEALGIPGQALRSRAVRIREKLEGCLTNCLKKR